MPFECVRVLYSRKGLDRVRFGHRKTHTTAATCGRPARTAQFHREGSRPPRIGSFPLRFRRLSISACRKAECRPHGRFVPAYQHTQGIRKLWRLSGFLQGPEPSTVGGSTPASIARRRLIQAGCFVLQMSAACRFLPLAAGSRSSGPVVASSDLHVLSATLFRSGSLHGPSLCPPCVSETSLTMCVFPCF